MLLSFAIGTPLLFELLACVLLRRVRGPPCVRATPRLAPISAPLLPPLTARWTSKANGLRARFVLFPLLALPPFPLGLR